MRDGFLRDCITNLLTSQCQFEAKEYTCGHRIMK